MSRESDPGRIATMACDVVAHPRQGQRAIIQKRGKADLWHKAVVDDHRHEAARRHRRPDKAVIQPATRVP